MKKFSYVYLVGIFLFSSVAIANTDEEVISAQCTTTIAVDCDGDTEADYEGTVDCEYAAALAGQFVDSCG